MYKFSKTNDDVFSGNHPGGIQEGYFRIGIFSIPPTVGNSFKILDPMTGKYLITSVVTEVIDEENFKTLNSRYNLRKYEKVE